MVFRAIAIARNDSRADFFRPEPIATLGVDAVSLGAYRNGQSLARLAMWAARGDHPSFPDLMLLEPGSLAWEVAHNGAPARMQCLRTSACLRPHSRIMRALVRRDEAGFIGLAAAAGITKLLTSPVC